MRPGWRMVSFFPGNLLCLIFHFLIEEIYKNHKCNWCNHKINWRSTILHLVYKTNSDKRYLHLSRIDAPESSNKVSSSRSFMSLFPILLSVENSASKFRSTKFISSYKTFIISFYLYYAISVYLVSMKLSWNFCWVETVLMSLSSYCYRGSYESMRNTNFKYKTSTTIFAEKITPRLI